MLLRAKSRMLLLSALPDKGSFDTLKIVRNLQSELSFSEEEHKVLDFKQVGEMTRWEDKFDLPTDITIGEKATDVIVTALKGLDSRKQLPADLYRLFDHFVNGTEWEEEAITGKED